MKTTEAIVDSIENRLRELNQEIASLTAARGALDGREDTPSAPAPAAATADGRSRRTPTGARRTSAASRTRQGRATRQGRRSARPAETVPAGKLELLLSENGGLTTSALTERTNGNRDQVLTLLRELEAAGRIRRSGQRRSTRWHAVTDEDRIRERAAELAARSKGKKG